LLCRPREALRMGGDEWREGTESVSQIIFGCRVHLCAGAMVMIKSDISNVYRDYIACLNKRDWPKLEQFLHDEVYYKDQRIAILGYREMPEKDFYEIPDLYFDIRLLISDPPYIASRLEFDCTPTGKFLGLDVSGKRVSFTENVFYEFRDRRFGKYVGRYRSSALARKIIPYLVSKRDCSR
jgi:predicted ester cyclase